MLVILLVAGATLMTLLYSLWKNAGKKDDLEDFLADDGKDGDEPESEPASGEPETRRQPWEKDADWWQD
jgi:hypothetical protein